MKYVLVLVVLAFSAGCVKMKNQLLLYPDGSGKFAFTIGLRNDVFSHKYGSKGEIDWAIEDFRKVKGVVAWLRPKVTKSGNYYFIDITGYFEEINAVKFEHNNPSFSFKKGENGASTLVFETSIAGEKKLDDNQVTRDFLKDAEIGYALRLPGKVEPLKKWQVQGRDAAILLGVDDIIHYQQKKNGVVKAEFVIGEPDKKIEKEQEAFKKELEAAKKEWEAYRKELEARE